MGHFVPSVRFYSEAARVDPKLVDDRENQHVYGAACSALEATVGKGVEEPQPEESARAKLRGQALAWLRTELDAWSRHLGSGRPGARAAILEGVGHWRLDKDLATVRAADALVKLPETERKDWQSLWVNVDRFLQQTQAGK